MVLPGTTRCRHSSRHNTNDEDCRTDVTNSEKTLRRSGISKSTNTHTQLGTTSSNKHSPKKEKKTPATTSCEWRRPSHEPTMPHYRTTLNQTSILESDFWATGRLRSASSGMSAVCDQRPLRTTSSAVSVVCGQRCLRTASCAAISLRAARQLVFPLEADLCDNRDGTAMGVRRGRRRAGTANIRRREHCGQECSFSSKGTAPAAAR